MSEPLKGFITYSHEDTEAKNELRKRLAVMEQQNELVTWDDGQLTPGDGALQEDILKNVTESDLLLYLVSAASLASKNCNRELAEALNLKIKVLPIILEHCDWLHHQLSGFEVLPHKGKPITKWEDESEGWQNVVDGIRKAIDEIKSQPNLSFENTQNKQLVNWVFQQGNFLVMLKQINMAIEAYSHVLALNPDDAEAYNNRGNVYLNKGELSKAIQDYRKSIDLQPDLAVAYANLGVAYFSKGKVDKAIEDYNRAIQIKPDYPLAYINRGGAYTGKGELDKAIQDFNTAIQLDPQLADSYNNRGNVYTKKGELDNAIQDFNTAIQLQPDDAIVYYNRGNAYSDKNDFDNAITDYTKAIQLKPDYADFYNNRGNAYRKKGDFDNAIQDFNTTIQLQPRHAKAHNNRGVAYEEKGELDNALKDYNAAIQLKPDYANAYRNRGIAYRSKGEVEQAIKDYNAVIKLKPRHADTYYYRGNAYKEKGDFRNAIKDYAMVIGLNPLHDKAYYNRGVTYEETGEIEQAIKDYTMAIELNPLHDAAYYNRGNVYLTRGNFANAIQDYNTAVQLDPGKVDAYNNRGIAYDKNGKIDYAIADFTKAIELKSDYLEAYFNRGLTYRKNGEYNRAIENYTTAIGLNPDYAEAYNNRGYAYTSKGEIDLAIKDYSTAIELDPQLALAYYNRAEAWLHLREWGKARADLIIAKNMGLDIIASFHNDYKNVETYEQQHRVKLPEDLALLLTQRRRTRYPKTQKVLDADGKPLESPNVVNLREQLRNVGIPLGEYVELKPAFGINTAPTEAFVIDRPTRDNLIAAHPASADILKPFLHGQDLRRWHVDTPHQWLIFAYRGIAINDYPAILKHLEKYQEPLSKRKGKHGWYELPASINDVERFAQPKLVCPDTYNHQTFAVDTAGYYYGKTSYLIPTLEKWLCGLLNSRTVEWFYSQVSKQLTIDWLRARSGYIQQIPIPDLTSTQKALIGKIVDYLIYLQQQPTTNSKDLKDARDAIMLGYFERIIDGLVYEAYLPEDLHRGDKHFFQPLLEEQLPSSEEIQGDKMSVFRAIFELLYERTHLVRRNLYYLDSVKAVRIIEGKI